MSLPVCLNQSKWSRKCCTWKLVFAFVFVCDNYCNANTNWLHNNLISSICLFAIYLSFHHAWAMSRNNKKRKNIVATMHLIMLYRQENTLKCTSAFKECESVIFMWQLTCFSHYIKMNQRLKWRLNVLILFERIVDSLYRFYVNETKFMIVCMVHLLTLVKMKVFSVQWMAFQWKCPVLKFPRTNEFSIEIKKIN